MSRVITIVNRELVVTSTNGSETQVQKIQILNNYYTQIVSTNVSVLNNEHKNVITFAASEFSPSSTAAQIQAYLSVLINNTAEVASATWGYDSVTKSLVYVKQMSDGSVQYESPIGTTYVLAGVIESVIAAPFISAFNILEVSGFGVLPSAIEWNIENTGGAAGTIDGVNLANGTESKGQKAFFYNPTGTFYLTDPVSYDATGTTFLITYTTI